YSPGKKLELQLFWPPWPNTGLMVTKPGRSWFSVPSPYSSQDPRLGRLNEKTPVCNCSIAAPWSTPSPTSDRTTQRSSAHEPTFGNRSLTAIPLCPYCLYGHSGFMSPRTESSPKVRPRLNGTGFPLSRSNLGLGSKVSMLEGPPCINKKMTRFTLGAKCGVFGASGFA